MTPKNKIWLWTAVDHFRKGILGWVLGGHSAETFRPLWAIFATMKRNPGYQQRWQVNVVLIIASTDIPICLKFRADVGAGEGGRAKGE